MGKRRQDIGPRNKWSIHDLRNVRPLNDAQRLMFQEFQQGNHLVAYGSAGTGKSYVGLYLALCEVLSHGGAVTIVRSAVQSRDMGFLPGTYEEKLAMYENPYQEIFADLLGYANSYNDMKSAGLVNFQTTSYLRGLTWDRSIVVIDEAQNMSWQEIHTCMTRVGRDSTVICLGDLAQNDLRKESTGFKRALEVYGRMANVSLVEFSQEDIVRSGFVRDWIVASEATAT